MTAPPPRIERYESLAYGLFLHWGLYSLLARGEWVWNHHKLPRDEYERMAERFTAEKFDAREIVAFAQRAGFRYICLTTRHHEGFSLYDTRGLNRFDAPHSAAGRDLVAELAGACHDAGMAMFFYHTTLDWWHPAFESDWDGYLAYLRDSVEILCTHYGRVDGFWFDGNWARADRDWQEDALYALIRRHQPECVLINNSSVQARGRRGHPELDVLTFEQGVPAGAEAGEKYLAREMCDTITSHWGTAADDFSAKSPAQLIRTLAACRRHGANYLVNIGPHADGSLPAYETAALEQVGRWIGRVGVGIYDGRPAGLVARGEDFVLRAGEAWHYYLHDLPIHGNMHLSGGAPGHGLQTVAGELPPIRQVSWLDNGEPLEFVQDAARGMLTFRATPHPYGSQTVVRLAQFSA